MAACLVVRSGGVDLPFRLRAGPVWILRRLSAMLLYPLLDDAVRYGQHAIHKSREVFVLG